MVSKGCRRRLPSASSLVYITPRATCTPHANTHIHTAGHNIMSGSRQQSCCLAASWLLYSEFQAVPLPAQATEPTLLYRLLPGGSIRKTATPGRCCLR